MFAGVKILDAVVGLFRDLADIIFPRYCVCCDERLTSEEKFICTACLHKIPRVQALDLTGDYVERLFWGRVPVVKANSVFLYVHGPMSNLVHQFKYKGNKELAVEMGKLMADELAPSGLFEGVDAIVPVPLHASRMRERGYNQSELLAEGIRERTNIPVWNDVVVRVVNNESQTHLSYEERRKNVQDIFQCIHPERLVGKHILMVDDVITYTNTLVALSDAILTALGENPNGLQLDGMSQVRISIVSLAYTWPNFALVVPR